MGVELSNDLTVAVGKSAPPVAVGTAAAVGIPLEDWVMILTIVYLLLQIVYLGYKFWTRAGRQDDE